MDYIFNKDIGTSTISEENLLAIAENIFITSFSVTDVKWHFIFVKLRVE